jgi:hypothetical protein
MYDFVVTADDVGALLAVDFTPMDDNGLQVVCKYNLKAISFFILQDHVVNLSKVCIILKSRSYQTQYKQHLFANGRSIHLLIETFVQGPLGKY